MRLTALSLFNYGNFSDQRIVFDPKPGVINLLMLPNGGGKTVMRHAFCDLLFGIHTQTPFGWRFGYSQMRIMAEAVAGVASISFGRRKGQGRTLIDADGNALDQAFIEQVLGRVDRTQLNRLFVMDTGDLRRAEKDLLANDGELGPALVSGAGGTLNLRTLRKSLGEARDQLAPLRRSATRPFYRAADRYVDARKRKEASLLRPDTWRKQLKDRDETRTQQAEANSDADAASAELTRLERIRRVRPLLAQHEAAAAWLVEHHDAPLLDPTLRDRLHKAREALVKADLTATRAQQDIDRTRDDLDRVTVDDTLLAEADAIAALIDQAGAARKARTDLPGVEAELNALTATVADGLRELGLDWPVEKAADAVSPRTAIARTRRLIQAHAAQRKIEQATPAAIESRTREREAHQADLDRLPAPGDVSALEALVKDIRADGDPVRRLRDAAQVRDTAAAALADALARVPGWTEGAEALIALPPLPLDAYERQATQADEAGKDIGRHTDLAATAHATRDGAREHLAALSGPAPLPDRDRLRQVRERRDQGWNLIYRHAFTPNPPLPTDEAAFTGPLLLPIAYERAVTDADSMADRIAGDADLIAKVATARKDLDQAETRLTEAEHRLRLAQQTEAGASRAWQQLCSIMTLGDRPSIRAVRDFLQRREAVITAHTAVAAAEAALSTLAGTHAAWAGRLRRALGHTDGTLPDLLAAADQCLTAAQDAAKTRAGLLGRLQAAETSLSEALNQRRKAEAERATWDTEWAQAMAALNRPAAEDPETTEDILRVLTDLDQARKDRVAHLSRVDGMRRDIAQFTADVRTLAARVAADLDPADPFATVTALRQRLDQAKAAANTRDERRKQASDAAEAFDQAGRVLQTRKAELAAVLTSIGADTMETAESRLILAEERARQTEALRSAEARLRDDGDSLPMDTLRAEADAVPPDALAAAIAASQTRRSEAQTRAQEASARVAELNTVLREAEDATAVNEAAADQQAAVAKLGHVLEDALVYHIAGAMLDQMIARVEETEAPKILTRISELFRNLTNGAYTRVISDLHDDGQAHLMLDQCDPVERKAIKDLSEGTRDQLFLALRLAAIEKHAETAPALPFIGDDILQTFDDDRAVAAMKVLCDVSDKVQVILLTHHRHVLDLAQRLPAGSVHVCQVAEIAMA